MQFHCFIYNLKYWKLLKYPNTGYWLNKLKDVDNGVLCSWGKE